MTLETGSFFVGYINERCMSCVRATPMRNISKFVVSAILLASQANSPIFGDSAATAESSTAAAGVYEVKFNTNTSSPVVIETQNKLDYEAEVMVPLRAAQAEVARKEAESKAAKAKAKRKTTLKVAAALVPGSHTDWMRAAGIAESDFGYVEHIISRESGWGVTKSNYAGSGAYGLGQALPASKMAKFGADYLTNPVTQLKWADAYAKGRYGSWAGAYAHWIARHNW